MATDHAPEFDLGPLSWVQGEIDQALSRGVEALEAFKASPRDATQLKVARTHIHQAAGAIQMVGLDAVSAYTEELERQLARMEELPSAEAVAACDLVDRACRKLKIFLDELVGGAHPVPLKLFPEYEQMQQARGLKAVSPTDLFFPDLSARAPKIASSKAVTPQRLQSYLVKQRRLFQRGLLSWLRGDEEAARMMRDAVQGIEDVQTHSAQRSFWWAVGALLESIVEKGVDSGFGVRQLCGRIDLQIRRFIEGSTKVADRMRREVLYYVAISAPVGPQVQAVQRAYRLPALIPSAEVLSADVVRVQPHLRDAREVLSTAKDLWLKLTGGRAESLPKLKATLSSLRDKTAAVGEPSLSKLASTLSARLEKLPSGAIPESLAMEYATGLLLAESAIENFAALSTDFPKQVEAMIARLDAAQEKRAVTGAGAPMLDEMARKAQERLLLAQVAREIQANLRHMEQVLDAFFRDNEKRGELATLSQDTRQIMGALKMLGLDHAGELLALCQQQIEEYAKPDTPVAGEGLELLAESLSGLGFYIEAVEQQRPDRERLIEPLLAKRLGTAAPAPIEEPDTVEEAVEELKASLPATIAALQRSAGEASVRERLAQDLTALKNDAELIGDEVLQSDADAALGLLASDGTGDSDALKDAIAAIASGNAAEPAPAPSGETQRLLETAASELDAELLEIYLTEADEVLDGVALSAAQLKAQPDDREALTTVRRGFHTLKGSGRMVGLTDLGEIAYEVEKIHNRLLEEERPATPAVLAMIDTAQKSFRVWVDTLRRKGRVTADPQPLRAAIAAVEAELPVDSDDAPAAAPVPKAPQPTPEVSPIEVLELDETPSVDPVLGGAELGILPAADPEISSGAEIIEFIPELAAAAEPLAAATSAADEVTVGDVTLSGALYRILCDEAQLHLATLDSELEALQFDTAQAPSQAMIRAGHTLCGIHRTGGFPLVAGVAKALEQCLVGLEERGAPLPSTAQPVLARAIAGLHALTARVRARDPFDAGDEAEAAEIGAELETLRHEAAPAATAQDSESSAERTAAAEEAGEAPANEDRPPEPEPPPIAPVVVLTPPLAPKPPVTVESPIAVAPPVEPEPAPLAPASFAAATAAPSVPSDDTLAAVRDEVDEQVLPIFLEEATELFPRAGEQLRAWRQNPGQKETAQALRRTLHTFKGSARMAGAMRLGELTHRMESRLLAGDVLAEPTPELFEALDTDLDHVAFVLDRLQKGESNTELPWIAAEPATLAAKEPAATPLSAREPEPAKPASREPASAAPVAKEPAPAAPSAVVRPLVQPSTPPAAPGVESPAAPVEGEASRAAMLRVRADLIDRLVNEAGEVAIARARVEGELRSLKSNLLELTNSVIRLRSQVREIEIQAESQIQSGTTQARPGGADFDPLEFDRFTRFQELTRMLAEGVNDVSTVQQALLRNIDDADAALLAQARLSRDVQQQLFSIRTVPFGSLSERLYRIMRQTAKELDKRANLEIHGTQVELDRSVLEKLVGPLEHLLRNALDHGVESRETRRERGKPETGEILLTVRQQGNEIAIEIADDGSGLDFERIRAKAQAQGLIAPDVEPTETRLVECIFAAGFSTATNITQISGRGVGMDVVRSEIAALGGRVEVATVPQRGTTFTLYLPLTLAVAQTVLVRAGGRVWALPSTMVEQVQQIKDKDLINLYLSREVSWQSRKYPFFYLPRLLGNLGHNPETLRYNSVLLLKSGQSTAAVHIDEMIGNQEVVVKNIGPQLARVSGIAGATVLGTGEVVLIINPVQLAQRFDAEAAAPAAVRTAQVAAAAAPVAGPALVLIVDDSLTVRKITSRLLTREGFDVLTAKDGLDAMQVLSERVPDAILLDIEMPRMDGFEFAKTVKADAKLAGIPIIMITSRTAEKHRSRAQQLGVEAYLGKPYQEEELLRQLRGLLALSAA
ncbi:MAG TPA: Hpt domain-containing protein [Casimicrobiaceae bacterium]|nr:Hpt domain-containing protein [Casimicrobiaceae bacterium]